VRDDPTPRPPSACSLFRRMTQFSRDPCQCAFLFFHPFLRLSHSFTKFLLSRGKDLSSVIHPKRVFENLTLACLSVIYIPINGVHPLFELGVRNPEYDEGLGVGGHIHYPAKSPPKPLAGEDQGESISNNPPTRHSVTCLLCLCLCVVWEGLFGGIDKY